MTKSSNSDEINKWACINFNLRTAYRKISKIYDEIMKPSGISGAQFFLMGEIYNAKNLSIVKLAEITDLDRTTLSRNLKILAKKGFVILEQGDNLKTKRIVLTPAGDRTLKNAIPYWQKAQTHVLEKIGVERWEIVKDFLKIL